MKYMLQLSVFVCGACVMALELAGARIIAPFFGTSIFVWSAIIGIILGSMSFGYYLGGKLADKNPSFEKYGLIIAGSAMSVALIGLMKNDILILLAMQNLGNKLSSIVAALLLFAVPSMILALVSPYAIRLSMASLQDSGKTAGNIYAISTLGSITGTFFTGFVLIPTFGNAALITLISMTLMVIALLFKPKKFRIILGGIVIFVVIAAFYNPKVSANMMGILIEKDTQYGTVIVYDNDNKRTMQVNNGSESAKFLDSDDLVFNYTKFYDLIFYFNPEVKSALALGGAGYSYPQHYLRNHPENTIDVVEIDPELTKLAMEYFGLETSPQMGIYHQDGRTFLNGNMKKYDAVIGDAFNSLTPPYELLTKEANDRIYAALNENGVYILNIITAVEGEGSKLFNAVYNTLIQTFPQVYVFPVRAESPKQPQNVVLVGYKSQVKPALSSSNMLYQAFLDKLYTKEVLATYPPITDDYAPIDYYVNNIDI